MLMPKKTKYRKEHKRNLTGKSTRCLNVSFGSYGLKSMTGALVTSRQIEAARRVITRYIKKGGKIWIRIFPDKSMTLHGNESPMGKGKGGVDHYVAVVKPGMVLFEVEGLDEKTAQDAMISAGHKLPLKSRFVANHSK
mgnify:CR=1 FL=1